MYKGELQNVATPKKRGQPLTSRRRPLMYHLSLDPRGPDCVVVPDAVY
jgi:hypothetical protein